MTAEVLQGRLCTPKRWAARCREIVAITHVRAVQSCTHGMTTIHLITAQQLHNAGTHVCTGPMKIHTHTTTSNITCKHYSNLWIQITLLKQNNKQEIHKFKVIDAKHSFTAKYVLCIYYYYYLRICMQQAFSTRPFNVCIPQYKGSDMPRINLTILRSYGQMLFVMPPKTWLIWVTVGSNTQPSLLLNIHIHMY